MCETQYEQAIENASELLSDAMLNEGLDELIAEGRQLDQKVHELVREVGRRTVTQLFEICGKALEEDAKREGIRCSDGPRLISTFCSGRRRLNRRIYRIRRREIRLGP